MADYKQLEHTAEEIDKAIEDEKMHSADTVSHITALERETWNNKPSASDITAAVETETLRATAAENANAANIEKVQAINKTTLGVECINLLENNCFSTEVNGVTITVNSDKSITLNGTNTGSSILAFPNMQTGAATAAEQYNNNEKWIPTGKYTMSIAGNNGGVSLQMRCAIEPNDAGTGYTTTTETPVEVTDAHNYVWNRLLISSGASFDNVTVYPMIRLAEITDSTYKAYQPNLQAQINELTARIAALEATATATTETEV